MSERLESNDITELTYIKGRWNCEREGAKGQGKDERKQNGINQIKRGKQGLKRKKKKKKISVLEGMREGKRNKPNEKEKKTRFKKKD